MNLVYQTQMKGRRDDAVCGRGGCFSVKIRRLDLMGPAFHCGEMNCVSPQAAHVRRPRPMCVEDAAPAMMMMMIAASEIDGGS